MDMPSWVTAFATLGLVFFASVQLGREICAAKRRRRAAASEVSGRAFLLKLHLEPWISGLAKGDCTAVHRAEASDVD